MLRFLLGYSFLLSPNNGDGGDGGGGSGGGAASGQPDGGNGDDGAKSVTKEWVEQTVNKAIGSRFREFETKQTKANETFRTELQTGIGTLLDEKLSGLASGGQGGGNQPGAGKSAGSSSDDVLNHPTVKGMAKTIEDLKKANTERDAAIKAEKQKTRDRDLRAKLTEELALNGISGVHAQHAVGYLIDSSKKVSFEGDDGDDIVFRDGKDTVDLSTGLKKWVPSEEGKLYTPPRNANGSGDGSKGGGGGGRKNGNGNNGQQPDRAALGQALQTLITGGDGLL